MRLRRNFGSRLVGSSTHSRPAAAQRVAEGLAPQRDQRADDPAAHGRDRGEAAHAGAAEHAHEHGLGLVVGGVADRDARGAEPVGRTPPARRSGPPARPPRPSRRPTCTRSTSTGTPSRVPSARTKSASRAESARRPWSTCSTCSVRRQAGASAVRTARRATESAPPDTATKTVSPPASIAWRRRVALDGVGEAPPHPPCRPTQTSPSSKCSFFQTGTVRLSVSIA